MDNSPSSAKFKAATAVFRLAWSAYQKSSCERKAKLPKGWIESPFDKHLMINPNGLRDTIQFVDICLSMYPELNDGGNKITALNLRAVAVRELGEFNAAIHDYSLIAEWADKIGDAMIGSKKQALKGIDQCRERIQMQCNSQQP
jgi:hypothetical protein